MGLLIVLSSPSGGGKTTIVRELVLKNRDFRRSISYTTRTKRTLEQNKIDYCFVSVKRFRDLVKKGFFIEWASVHGDLYGTSRKAVIDARKQRKDTFFAIDVKGGLNIKRLFPDAVLIFLAPPTYFELKNRLMKRKREDERAICLRLSRALFEFRKAYKYDYWVVNRSISKTVQTIENIIATEKQKIKNHKKEIDKLIKQLSHR